MGSLQNEAQVGGGTGAPAGTHYVMRWGTSEQGLGRGAHCQDRNLMGQLEQPRAGWLGWGMPERSYMEVSSLQWHPVGLSSGHSGLDVLLTEQRPKVEDTGSEELGKPMWTWQEQHLPQAPGRTSELQWVLLSTPHWEGLHMNADESYPHLSVSPGGCRRQRHRLQPGAERQAGWAPVAQGSP